MDVLIARRINALLGGAFVAPWEIGELDDATIDAILCLDNLPAYQKGYREVQDYVTAWRKRHPTYKK
jgi:hypothetical protein